MIYMQPFANGADQGFVSDAVDIGVAGSAAHLHEAVTFRHSCARPIPAGIRVGGVQSAHNAINCWGACHSALTSLVVTTTSMPAVRHVVVTVTAAIPTNPDSSASISAVSSSWEISRPWKVFK